MTSCDSCGELTRHAVYFDGPYWICCPRCAEGYARRTGNTDNATAKNLALEDARRYAQEAIEAHEVGAMVGLTRDEVDGLIGRGVMLKKGRNGNGRT